jgi:hypothetical protein
MGMMGVMEEVVEAAVQLAVQWEQQQGRWQLDVGSCQLVSCFCEAKRRRGRKGGTDWAVEQGG